MLEHKIGQIVGIRDKKYIVEVYSGQECDLKSIVINCEYLACKQSERSDEVQVVYKELEGTNEK